MGLLDHPPTSVVCYCCRAPIAVRVLPLHHAACLAGLERYMRELPRPPLCGLLAFPRPPKVLCPGADDTDDDRRLSYSLEAVDVFDSMAGGCKGCACMYPLQDLPAHFVACSRRSTSTSQPCPIEVRLPCYDLMPAASPARGGSVVLVEQALTPHSGGSPEVPETALTPYKRRLLAYPPPPSPLQVTVARSPVFRSQQRVEEMARCCVCSHEVPTQAEREAEAIRLGKANLAAHRRIEAQKKIGRDRRRQADYDHFHPAFITVFTLPSEKIPMEDHDEDDAAVFVYGDNKVA